MTEIVINIIECLMLSYFLFSLMDIKENKKILYFISLFITSTTIITLSNYISMYDIFLTSVIILSNIIVSYFFVNNDLSEIVFYACLETLVSAFSAVLAIILMSEPRSLYLFFSKFCYLILAFSSYKIFKKRGLIFNSRLYIVFSVLMFILQYIISSFLQLYIFFLHDYPELNITFLFLLFFILAILCLIVYIFDLSQVKQEYDKLKSIQDSNNIITNLYNEVKIAKHDVKHVYEMIEYYLENKEYEKISDYIDSKNKDIHSIPILIQSKNEIINMILNNKIVKAYSKNIKVECDISVKDNLFVNDYDLNEFLSNALDNAIENNIETGYIRLKIMQENNYIYISIINSTDNKEIKTKKDSNNHGFGLKSIRRICNKYNGDMEISLENGEFKMKMTLIA